LNGHRIKAGLPAGVRTGSKVPPAGQGEQGQNGGAAGDLYLIVHINPNETFEARRGINLHMEVPVDIFTAIAGGENPDFLAGTAADPDDSPTNQRRAEFPSTRQGHAPPG